MNAIVTKVFKSGNSLAVRLPRELGFEADAVVQIERRGNEVVIVDAGQQQSRFQAMLKRLADMPRPAEPEQREPFDYPDRPGLID
ncbi:AbrB/MazE/SpoVT family DNA-binding domain-containing protein [Sandaracinobacter neustonicus]|uniref:AbrB/MazE/SpoVT family DNA-binding domain-containing protein n=1 Tax=Sandaracinobacter neustonicus TaxID=1715348 RepID=A0A501XG62_9SPHN|nr:AbrB/MazE/SpoVT family DNA-binding domain-containing protein [Sandaracinobacter neustonicus]TPE59530.1 AbrB/MazE/SpoVT family DNA-binding domain-containing protein [Sandaracinobacter neustonicus]